MDITDCRPEVIAFAIAMETELRKHDVKKGRSWKSMEASKLMRLLRGEMRELNHALTHIVDPSEVLDECADVGNIAMMIADVAGTLK